MKFKTCFLCAILLTVISAQAQLKDPSYSISVVPTIGNRFMTYKTDVGKSYKDSIRKADRWRDAIGAGLMLGFKSGKNDRIFIGLQFHNFGFTRRRENYRFLDTIHPEIGIMNDLSQTGGNYVDFNYRYMYLSVPFLYSKQISGKKLKASTIHFIVGGSLSGLVKHDVYAQLRGFTVRGGKKEFELDDKGSEPGLLNGNIHVGFRLENLIYEKNTFVFVQPTLYAPLLNANYSSQRQHLYAIGIEIGLMYKPEKDK